jgi:hypothetical protein
MMSAAHFFKKFDTAIPYTFNGLFQNSKLDKSIKETRQVKVDGLKFK